jgi:hypothetical protein
VDEDGFKYYVRDIIFGIIRPRDGVASELVAGKWGQKVLPYVSVAAAFP